MAINRVTSKDDLYPQYKYTGEGTKLILTRKAPGVITLTTPGEYQVVVDHVSFYLDAEMHLFADRTRSIERWHLVYRFGDQGEAVPSAMVSAVKLIVSKALDRLAEYGDEIGFVAASDEDADDQETVARLTREPTEVQGQVSTRRAKAAQIAEELRVLDGREALLRHQIGEVRTRIEERAAALEAQRAAPSDALSHMDKEFGPVSEEAKAAAAAAWETTSEK